MTVEEGAFTITSTVGGASTNDDADGVAASKSSGSKAAAFVPSPRFSAGMTFKQGILYLFGGTFEDGEVTYTLKDFYCLGESVFFSPPTKQFSNIKNLSLLQCENPIKKCLPTLNLWFFSSDTHKLDEWQVLIESDLKDMEWYDSDSEDDDDDEDDSEEDMDDD